MSDLKNTQEAAIMLGVTATTITRWFEKGLFPGAYKIRRTIRIPLSDIESLKQASRRAAS